MSTLLSPKGLEGVVAASSSICWIDGDAGVLSYRGIDIHALAELSELRGGHLPPPGSARSPPPPSSPSSPPPAPKRAPSTPASSSSSTSSPRTPRPWRSSAPPSPSSVSSTQTRRTPRTRPTWQCAQKLNLNEVKFIQQDAREADLSAGTVFYLHAFYGLCVEVRAGAAEARGGWPTDKNLHRTAVHTSRCRGAMA